MEKSVFGVCDQIRFKPACYLALDCEFQIKSCSSISQ